MDLLQFTRNFDSNGSVRFPGLRFCQNKTYHMAGRMLKRTVVFDTRYNSHDEAHCGILIQGTTHMMKRTVVFWYTVQLTRWSALWYFGTGYNSHDERKGRRSLYIWWLKCNLHWLNFCLKWYIICYVHIFWSENLSAQNVSQYMGQLKGAGALCWISAIISPTYSYFKVFFEHVPSNLIWTETWGLWYGLQRPATKSHCCTCWGKTWDSQWHSSEAHKDWQFASRQVHMAPQRTITYQEQILFRMSR